MDVAIKLQKLCHVEIRRLVLIIGIVVSFVAVFQSFELPFGNKFSLFIGGGSVYTNTIINTTNSKNQLAFENGTVLGIGSPVINASSNQSSSDPVRSMDIQHNVSNPVKKSTSADMEEFQKSFIAPETSSYGIGSQTPDSRIPILVFASNTSSTSIIKQDTNDEPLRIDTRTKIRRGRNMQPTSLSEMNSMLIQNFNSSNSTRSRWSSTRDEDLRAAKLKILNAPIVRKFADSYASLYRNVSMFTRSYELMEHVLKVYIYKEGERPIFHESKMDGIYASEGWFMKIMEANKHFVVNDPRKAHLFYLPFSSRGLRALLDEKKPQWIWRDLQEYLDNYVDMIAAKYRFWNRTEGADHFLVACHDWAPRITRSRMINCIRSLCNSNAGTNRGFIIGKDTTLPVTLIKGGKPLRDLGGKPGTERPTLTFFAGNMHGSLRPVLLKYWENKYPDMKIFGPMPRDRNGTSAYKEHMKSSKFCICARGYDVHTPRVVEAILYECVPVIIADNYVPPFFEVLDWESFAVFVKEEDIPDLRNILLEISEKKYLAMQTRVKMVQKHFLWHKEPVKYDAFHMVLHSVWYNRVFQMKTRGVQKQVS